MRAMLCRRRFDRRLVSLRESAAPRDGGNHAPDRRDSALLGAGIHPSLNLVSHGHVQLQHRRAQFQRQGAPCWKETCLRDDRRDRRPGIHCGRGARAPETWTSFTSWEHYRPCITLAGHRADRVLDPQRWRDAQDSMVAERRHAGAPRLIVSLRRVPPVIAPEERSVRMKPC